MKISVVIATFNRSDKLRDCLTALVHQSHSPHEIIVVDDASTDQTSKMVGQEFPHVKLMQQGTNRGPAAARNRGINDATGEIIAFTDDDCIVPEAWLKRIVNGFIRYPNVAGVGGYQEAPENLQKRNIFAMSEHVMRLKRWRERALREQYDGFNVPGFGTNNVAYRRDVLLDVGGFDETFPVAAGEDTDLKLRIAQKGYRLLYLPLKVEHHRSYTLRHQWQLWVRRGIGAYYFEAKHDRPPGLFRVLLRFAKRKLLFFPDLVEHGWRLAAVFLLTRLADAYGQLTMVFKAKIKRRSQT